MPSIPENLTKAAKILAAAEIPDPRREAGSLLALAIGKTQTFLFAHPEYILTGEEQIRFDEYVRRRAGHEPYHYIAGHREFYGLDYIVTPDVLIPRPETEVLVEAAINLLKDGEKLCEVGAGSGCISISILHHTVNTHAVALDISEAALTITARNAVLNKVGDRLKLRHSNVFSALEPGEMFDMIVSNPPYIPAEDIAGLQIEVKDHDPLIALTDGGDGLSIIRKLIDESPNHLRSGGYLFLEIGHDQSNAVREMVSFDIWESLEFLPDMQQIERVAKLKLHA